MGESSSGYPGHSHFLGGYRLLTQVAPHANGVWRVWVGLRSDPLQFATREEAETYAMERAEANRPCTVRIIKPWGLVERECQFPLA
jgi:hypothetical protein